MGKKYLTYTGEGPGQAWRIARSGIVFQRDCVSEIPDSAKVEIPCPCRGYRVPKDPDWICQTCSDKPGRAGILGEESLYSHLLKESGFREPTKEEMDGYHKAGKPSGKASKKKTKPDVVETPAPDEGGTDGRPS